MKRRLLALLAAVAITAGAVLGSGYTAHRASTGSNSVIEACDCNWTR